MSVIGLKTQGTRLRAIALALACFALLVSFTPTEAADPLPPELTLPVNDFAHVIDPQSASTLNRQIRDLKAASGDVVVVATVETFAPYANIEEYASRMFENRGRGIGEKGKDSGLLVVLALKDRKVRVEVGYDLEQFITDGYAGEVRDHYLTPAFARGDYGGGLVAGVTQIIGRIAQARGVTLTGVPPPAATGTRNSLPISPGMIITLIILFAIFSRMGRRSRMMRGGRRWGAGPWSGWNSGVGPFGGGGGFGGGGFGGGFGGFGGGRSGGGGASGGW